MLNINKSIKFLITLITIISFDTSIYSSKIKSLLFNKNKSKQSNYSN